MARLFLTSGQTYSTVGAATTPTDVNGTNASEIVNVAADGDAYFDPSFGRGNDTINILGNAANYTAQVVGANLVLTSASGADIRIPITEDGVNLTFADTGVREVFFKAAENKICLGDQQIPTTGSVAVAAGSGGSGGGGGGGGGTGDGTEIFLTENRDIKSGTTGNDVFNGDIVQVNGLQVNSLGTGDNLQGGTGFDWLMAQLTRGATFGDTSNIQIQPRTNSVERITLEGHNADLINTGYAGEGYWFEGVLFDQELFDAYSDAGLDLNTQVYFNAKDVRGHTEIGSYRSEADIIIQDLTTVTTDGGHDDARNTSDITITMAYSEGQDTRWDASDLHAYFDQDYLLSGRTAESQAFFWILDQDADEIGGPLLDNINVDGIRFRVNGGPVVTLNAAAAQQADTHAGFVAALQAALQVLIANGDVPADTTLTVDPTFTDFTFLDNGARSSDIPAIVLTTQTNDVFTPVGFSQVQDALGQYNVYGRFTNEADVQDLPVSVHIALEKVGSGGHGGEVIVGSMDKYHNGIEQFDVTVYGDDSRPSWVEYLNSTGDAYNGIGQNGALRTIYIESDNTGFPTDTWASLTVGGTNNFLQLIDATGFFGNLTLGVVARVANLKTLIATGGGNVTYYGDINSSNAYTYTTGTGKDLVNLTISGSALEGGTSSLLIDTGAGDDEVVTNTTLNDNDQLPNQVILNNVDIMTGAGQDTIRTYGVGNFRIDAGSEKDTIYTGNEGDKAVWVFNVDAAAYQTSDEIGALPGVPLQKALLDGAVVTVTFSGAGNLGGGFDGGGGVMEGYGLTGREGDAVRFVNGIESIVTIDVPNNKFYGDERDVNNAILTAINTHPVLSKLLVASVGANNTLIVRSLIDGQMVTTDLDIQIKLPEYTTLPTALIQEAISLGFIDSNEVTPASKLIVGADGNNIASGDGAWNLYNVDVNAADDGDGATPVWLQDNLFYFGIDNGAPIGAPVPAPAQPPAYPTVNNLYAAGSAGTYESDNVITAGTGNDVTVLSTDNISSAGNRYWSLDGHLFDRGSNETLVYEEDAFGNDTVVNFMTAGVEDYFYNADNPAQGGSSPLPMSGFDMIDFTAYLDSRMTPSGSSTSLDPVPVSLTDLSSGATATEDTPVDNGVDTLTANEVLVVDLIADGVDGESFAGLTAAKLAQVINGTYDSAATGSTAGAYGSLNNGDFLLDDTTYTASGPGSLANKAASAIIMVQNGSNLGDYKVFEVNWTSDGDAGATTKAVATVIEHGTIDFGATLVGLDEINFVGSIEQSSFNAFG